MKAINKRVNRMVGIELSPEEVLSELDGHEFLVGEVNDAFYCGEGDSIYFKVDGKKVEADKVKICIEEN